MKTAPIRLNSDHSIAIRSVESKDVNEIWENFNETIDEKIYLPFFNKVYDDFEKRGWFREIQKGMNFCLVAEDCETHKIAGQITIEDLDWEAAHFVGSLGIIIKKDYRNLKVGRNLIECAKKIALNKGKKKIILSTYETNKSAIKLYKNCGFKECGRYTKQYHVLDEYIDEILMEVLLTDY